MAYSVFNQGLGSAVAKGAAALINAKPSTGVINLGANAPRIVPQVYPGSTGSGSNQNVSTSNYGGYTPTSITPVSYTSSTSSSKSSSVTLSTKLSSGTSSSKSSSAPSTPIIVKPTSYNVGANTVADNTSGTVAPIVMPSAPSVAGGSLGTTVQNNATSGLNPDGTQKVTATTGTAVDLGYGMNPDGTAKTATQAISDRLKNEFSQMQPNANLADQYNKAITQSGQNEAQTQVNNLTNQVNGINARIQTDLQSLRGVGAKEGVTEAVYGQQNAEVVREGNLQLLPLQAQLSAAQGNLDVAKQQTDTLFKIYSQDAQNSVDFYNKQVEALANADIAGITSAEKTRLDNIQQQKQNDFTILNEQIQSYNSATNAALARGDVSTYDAIASGMKGLNTNVNSPTFAADNKKATDAIEKTVVDSVSKQVSTDLNNSLDSTSGSILSQTGLSIPAFSYLTQGTAALTRMTAAQRTQYMKEAENWANKNGIDVSTFGSQYKAYNEVLQKNIQRANMTQVFGNEVSSTVDQFVNDIGNSMSQLNVANVVRLFAGEQVNDPLVMKYGFDLQTMRNDLAGYYAASRGSNTPENADLIAANGVIANGINAGSAQAFKESINTNEQKVTRVVNSAVDSTRKQVWDLFGVGNNYQSAADKAISVGTTITGGDGKQYVKTGANSYELAPQTTNTSTQTQTSTSSTPSKGFLTEYTLMSSPLTRFFQ